MNTNKEVTKKTPEEQIIEILLRGENPIKVAPELWEVKEKTP